MSEEGVELHIDQDADVTIITVLNARVPVDLSESFEERVIQHVDSLDTPKVLIDFGGVEFISSAVLGKLIKLNGRLQSRGGELRLSSLNDRLGEVFRITGLDRLFEIHEGRDDAVRAFA
jgi:anti-sigma B factor antagonist